MDTQAHNEKSAQDIMEILRRAGSGIAGAAGNASGGIQEWFANLSPDVKKTVMRGLIGAGVGGATIGGLKAMTPRDPEEGPGRVLGPALLGALLGGTAGAALPLGMKALSGGVKFPGEPGKGAISSVTDPAVRHGVKNVGFYAGAPLLYGAGRKLTQKDFPEGLLKSVSEGYKKPVSIPKAVRARGGRAGAKAFAGGKKSLSALKGLPPHLKVLGLGALGGGYALNKVIKGDY